MRICHICRTEVEDKQFCPVCSEAIKSWPEPDLMTADERVSEMKLLRGPLEVPFPLLHERIEKLVGRLVWTHELGFAYDNLIEEARNRQWYDGNTEQAFQKAMENTPADIKAKMLIMDDDSVSKYDEDVPESFEDLMDELFEDDDGKD